MDSRPVTYYRSDIIALNYGSDWVYPELSPEGLIRIMDKMYDFIYIAKQIVCEMICPDRYIDVIVSAEQPHRIDGVSYTNSIIIYPLNIIRLYPVNLWFTSLLQTICHEIYHCILLQDAIRYTEDEEYHAIIERQTDYMAFKFIEENKTVLENKLGINIDLLGLLKSAFGDKNRRVIPFFKDLNGIEYTTIRDLWLDCISAGNPYAISKEFIEIFDRSNNIDIELYNVIDKDPNSIPNGYMCEDIIKKDGVFLPPCREFMDIRIFERGTMDVDDNHAPSLILFDKEEGDHMYVTVFYNTERRVPFFKKPV